MRCVSFLLRHGAKKQSVTIDDEGFVAVYDVLQWLQNHSFNCPGMSKTELEYMVQVDPKNLFFIDKELNKIRANSGHSLAVKNLALSQINETCLPHFIIHETYLDLLPNILKLGLNRCNRQ